MGRSGGTRRSVWSEVAGIFQRRDRTPSCPSPAGRAETDRVGPFSRPCGAWLFRVVHPRLKPWAIVTRPSGTRAAASFTPRPVPEGHSRIARRFNAGIRVPHCPSPAGTAETPRVKPFNRPCGAWLFRSVHPRLKPWAIAIGPCGTHKRLVRSIDTSDYRACRRPFFRSSLHHFLLAHRLDDDDHAVALLRSARGAQPDRPGLSAAALYG